MEKYVELVRLVVGRKMGKTSKGRGLPEKWPKKGENKNSIGSSRKRDKMNTGCVFKEKLIKLVILVVGRKMGKTSKGRGLPEKWQKNDKNENGVGSSRKHDKMNTGCVFIDKWVKLVILGVAEKWVKRVTAGGHPKNGTNE